MTNETTNDQLIDYYYFLDGLRESGVTNMYGAAPYLADEYDMTTKYAREILAKWMQSYDPNLTPEDRVLGVEQ
jgi:hypothetical protein